MIECQKCGSIEPDRVRPNRILYRLAKAFCYCLYSVQMPGGPTALTDSQARSPYPTPLAVTRELSRDRAAVLHCLERIQRGST